MWCSSRNLRTSVIPHGKAEQTHLVKPFGCRHLAEGASLSSGQSSRFCGTSRVSKTTSTSIALELAVAPMLQTCCLMLKKETLKKYRQLTC